jgi:hypothetical protein
VAFLLRSNIMAVRTSAGTTIGIVANAPATFDAAGYNALTFVTIGEVTDLGEFGREFALVTHNPIGSRGTVKKKGSFNEGSISMTLGLDTDDAGQILAKAAALSDDDYSFEVTTQNGDKYFFRAQTMMFKVNVGSVDSITTANITLEITTNNDGIGIVESLA